MVFRTTPQLGQQLSDVGANYWDELAGITVPSPKPGNKELGSDGGEYWFVTASADIASTATTGTQVALTYPAYTVATGSGGLNPVPVIIGGVIVLVVLVGGGIAISRRRKPAIVGTPMMGYGVPSTPGYNNAPNQGYGAFPANMPGTPQSQPGQGVSMVRPQTPAYPAQPGQRDHTPVAELLRSGPRL